ncbi:hypothetical protein QF032_000018 [Streptomyces achromogenes]|uniref:hypothetical protein n=1 Tax=Streptomyces achromogenes TaxID=67255 RepID=UPI00277DAE12|nr:hypothetical protein [Streptomyces achromogenes]MDQ0828174.1 hypothetical protein [Streptomyces achromogenes]
MASKHKTTQERPIDLPVGFNAWLLDCAPMAGCKTCQSEWERLNAAKAAGKITLAASHATQIRDHASGVHS